MRPRRAPARGAPARPARGQGRLRGGAAAGGRPLLGAAALGVPIAPHQLPRIDLVVAGSVAVNRKGARVGKGGGYRDLEFALASELGAVDAQTTVVTTVHDLQVLADTIPMTSHDVPIDLVVTPTRVIPCRRIFGRPARIEWDALTREQVAAMPALARLRPGRARR